MISANLAAFLTMLSVSEGTSRVLNVNGVLIDPYRVCFGKYHVIVNLSDHPAVTGEWHGEPLRPAMCIAAGLTWPCVSTAAGRYQINKPVWLNLKRMLRLPDFTAPSQDAAAVELIREKGALDLVNAGRAQDAIALCHGIWASLPGSTAGQPIKTLASLMAAYTDAGGGFA